MAQKAPFATKSGGNRHAAVPNIDAENLNMLPFLPTE
jgi:hypothetical protein